MTGKECGLCSACDGAGRCTATPDDDEACGAIDCSGLDTACRAYGDLTSNRCAALGACKAANDPAVCTEYADLSCADGGTSDGGQSDADGGESPSGSSGCGCRAAGGAGGTPWVLLGVALAVVGPRRRRAG